MSHYNYRSLNDFQAGVYGLFQNRPNRPLYVFVHGFNGSSQGTWGRFPIYTSMRMCGDCIFYQYESFRNSIVSNAEDLLRFFMDLEDSGLLDTRFYSQLVLIGHSEGSVVIRQALLFVRQRVLSPGLRSFLFEADVRFFAPAHFGFSPSGVFGVLFHLGAANIVRAALRMSRGYVEMKERILLNSIKEQTELRQSISGCEPCYFAKAVFGREEDVVVRAVYLQDKLFPEQHGESHTTVCKPRHDYQFPLTFTRTEGDE